MPLYEYKCGHCGEEFDKLSKSQQADDPKTCPNCGAQDSKRLVSVFGSVFGCGSGAGYTGGG
jgi:putative FmdB family regulatory protein